MLGVAIYGENGHQCHGHLHNHPRARLVAAARVSPDKLKGFDSKDVTTYDSLDALLTDPHVDLVSLCSPFRRDQAHDAIACLDAGKHVYAEKPCALSEVELDAILAAATRNRRSFHEMAGTAFSQPYLAMRKVVQSGTLGEIIQVLVQKSYPYFDARPQDEAVDGGLLIQVGVHATRMIEHVCGLRIETVQAWETALGNPQPGQLRMATAFSMTLSNGALATAIANYLNPQGTGVWGNESLTIFGANGLVESHAGGKTTRLVISKEDRGPLDVSEPGRDYLEYILDEITHAGPMPVTLEEELHPTRVLLRAKAAVTRVK